MYAFFHSLCDHIYLTLFSAALEVYVRRAYRAYSLLSVDYEEGDGLDDGDSPNILTWRFNLGKGNSPPSTPSLGSPCVSVSTGL